eukprot:gene14473-4265_t
MYLESVGDGGIGLEFEASMTRYRASMMPRILVRFHGGRHTALCRHHHRVILAGKRTVLRPAGSTVLFQQGSNKRRILTGASNDPLKLWPSGYFSS